MAARMKTIRYVVTWQWLDGPVQGAWTRRETVEVTAIDITVGARKALAKALKHAPLRAEFVSLEFLERL